MPELKTDRWVEVERKDMLDGTILVRYQWYDVISSETDSFKDVYMSKEELKTYDSGRRGLHPCYDNHFHTTELFL